MNLNVPLLSKIGIFFLAFSFSGQSSNSMATTESKKLDALCDLLSTDTANAEEVRALICDSLGSTQNRLERLDDVLLDTIAALQTIETEYKTTPSHSNFVTTVGSQRSKTLIDTNKWLEERRQRRARDAAKREAEHKAKVEAWQREEWNRTLKRMHDATRVRVEHQRKVDAWQIQKRNRSFKRARDADRRAAARRKLRTRR